MHALLRATGRRGRALSARAGVGHSGHLSADSLKNQHDAPDLGMAMSHKHKYLFDLNGFLVLRNVFSAEDVAAANAAVDAHVDTYHERTGQLRTSGLYGRESKALWVANKRFEISKFKFKFPRARTYKMIVLVLGCIEANFCK